MRTFHASRSRYEAFMRCPRYGLFQYAWDGRGLVKQGKDVAMTTGIFLHKCLEQIFKWLIKQKTKELPEYALVHILHEIRKGYFAYIFPPEETAKGRVNGFNLAEKGVDEFDEYEKAPKEFTDREKERIQQMTFNEQTALIEALVRLFVMRKLPEWLSEHRIVMVEKDMSFPLVAGDGWEVTQSATIDLVLQHETSKELFVVNYKGLKRFDNRTAKGYSHDTQGLSESWALEQYLSSIGKPRKADGVKMLFLIKGDRRESKKDSGIYITHSPLIRGYRKLDFDGPAYAHSLYYPKPENDSGVGRLGRGWEPFEVFEGAGRAEVGGIKGWLDRLATGEIQPECGDILESQLVEPIPFNRQEKDIESWHTQTVARETDISKRILEVENSMVSSTGFYRAIDSNFPQNHSACHYPTDCDYIPLCYGTEEEKRNPYQCGYVPRQPHHVAEFIQIGEKQNGN